ncbi:fluoride efflux transporter FluC [Jatrophihabitans sp. DSM 45814]
MLATPTGTAPSGPAHLRTIAVISLGGGVGSIARYGLEYAYPARPGQIPWATLGINLAGSLLLGMLVVAVTEIWRPHPLVRPALGTGVLGGFTTFSTFAVEVRGLIADHPITAASYLLASVLGGLAAAVLGMSLIRRLEPRLAIASEHESVDPIDPELP